MDWKPSDWADLPYFLAVARTGSLRAAADVLAATHATVNRRISQLEAGFGVQLFERSVEGLTLTPAGEELLPLAIKAEEAVTSGRRRLSGRDQRPEGRVRLSIPPALAQKIVAPLIASFDAKHPGIEVEINVTDRFEDIARHETDVSLRVAFSVADDVVGRRVLQYTVAEMASPDYIDAHFPTAGPGGEGLTWIGWGDVQSVPDWVARSPFPKAQVRHTVREGTLHVGLVQAGLGMSILPWFASEQNANVMPVPGARPRLDRSLWLLLHSDLRRTLRVRLLVDHLAEGLRAQKDRFLGPLAKP